MHFRLRNPPPGFITRPKESAELVAALERAPLAIVWGLGGFGKSALARAVLHEHFSKAVPRAVAIDVRPQESNTEILGEIARAIGERVSPKRARWAETARDPQALLMTALDLADAHDLWLVIDDAHNIDAPTLALLLGTLAGFARSSRWLFVSRVRPDFAELAGQLVQVPAMSREALRALCEQTAPLWSKEDCQRAAQAAAGSPWRLLQLAAQRQYTFNETLVRSAQNDVLLGLDARQQSLLFDLCLLDRPVPISALSEVSPMVDTLDRRGLIELEAGAQARLHDVARELLLPLLTDQEMTTGRAARLAEKLAGRPESVCAVEAVALFLRAVQPEKAAATASERSQGIVKDAQAARLWQVLQAEDDASFATAKQACALALEGGPALQWFVAQPAPADLDQRFAWLSALYMALQLARVIAEGDAFEESARAAGRNDLLAESLLLHAEVLCNLSQPESAAALLEDFRDGDETQMARRDALLARALLLLGQSREATRLAERLVNQFATLRAAARRRVFADLVGLLGDLGRMRWVARITEETDDLTDYVYQHRVHHLIEAGHLDEGVNAYARLLPFSRWPPLYAIPLRLLYSQLCLMRGDFLGLDAHVLETTEEAERCGHAEFIGWTWVPQYLLAIHRGRTLPERALTTNGPEAYYVRALQQIGAMRAHGRVPPEGWLEDDAVPEIVDVRISWYRAFALRAVLQKDFGEAKRRADAMLALAQDNDVAMHACDALVLAAEIALVAGDRAVAAEHAQKLAARAKKMNSLLYASEAEFFAAVTKVPCLDPAPLERLLTQEDTDPCAARRSRALLGGGGGDAYDQLLTEAILGLANIEITGDAGAKWGLDYVRKRVWFADRAPLPLDRHKLSWSLLTAIAEAGEISGEISKEELTVRVWSRPDYHPLRDDKRLQVALSRLRETLGDHSRIETTVAGYRIAGSLRRLKPRR